MKHFLFLLLTVSVFRLYAQKDTLTNKTVFTGDFRFRVEQDWHSRRSDGTFRTDRSRLRFRFRFGLTYRADKYSAFGGRLRTGNLNDQQGPHVTLGSGTGEFGLIQIGLEKLFYRFSGGGFKAWAGKNSLYLEKENELFWNDNVFPEGVALRYDRAFSGNSLRVNAGHFIIKSNNASFVRDSYFQLLQLSSTFFKKRLKLYPALYFFHEVGNIPDNRETFTLSYSLLHFGARYKLVPAKNFSVSVDYYKNLQDYSLNEEIPADFTDQTNGLVVSAKWGKLKRKGDWTAQIYYACLQKYAVVDYFAQNDWARWDYSGFDARGSRLTNFQGTEIRLGYALKEKYKLVLRTYFVSQLKKESGAFLENGNRIRLDLDIGF